MVDDYYTLLNILLDMKLYNIAIPHSDLAIVYKFYQCNTVKFRK